MVEIPSTTAQEEKTYKDSLGPLALFEKIWLLILIFIFGIGAAFSYVGRIDKNPPASLTLDNYGKYLSIEVNVGSFSGGGDAIYDGVCSITFRSAKEYKITDFKITISLSAMHAQFADDYTYVFDSFAKGEGFQEKEIIRVDLSSSHLDIVQWSNIPIECKVISISGGLTYAK